MSSSQDQSTSKNTPTASPSTSASSSPPISPLAIANLDGFAFIAHVDKKGDKSETLGGGVSKVTRRDSEVLEVHSIEAEREG